MSAACSSGAHVCMAVCCLQACCEHCRTSAASTGARDLRLHVARSLDAGLLLGFNGQIYVLQTNRVPDACCSKPWCNRCTHEIEPCKPIQACLSMSLQSKLYTLWPSTQSPLQSCNLWRNLAKRPAVLTTLKHLVNLII